MRKPGGKPRHSPRRSLELPAPTSLHLNPNSAHVPCRSRVSKQQQYSINTTQKHLFHGWNGDPLFVLYSHQNEVPKMKNGVPIVIAIVNILSALTEFATAVLDGKPETTPDLNRLLARILAAIAGAKTP